MGKGAGRVNGGGGGSRCRGVGRQGVAVVSEDYHVALLKVIQELVEIGDGATTAGEVSALGLISKRIGASGRERDARYRAR